MNNNLFTNIISKERSANFTKTEMDRLQTLVAKHKDTLFCKKTDGISSKQKESAWHLIECEFNALGDTPRTMKQLKYKFENLKRIAKKGASKERQEMRRTGGGPPPLPTCSSDDATDWLRSIMPTSVDGNEAVYDDDTLSQNIVLPGNKLNNSTNLEAANKSITKESQISKVPEGEITLIEINEACNKKEFDTSTPYSSLKRPISSPLRLEDGRCQPHIYLRRASQSSRVAMHPRETKDRIFILFEVELRKRDKKRMVTLFNIRQLLREKKIAVMDNLQELELKKINESIRHAQEVHDQTLRHNEERHQLELEKLKLEIQVLKKNLEF